MTCYFVGGSTCSIPGQSLWDLWWANWHLHRFSFSLSASRHTVIIATDSTDIQHTKKYINKRRQQTRHNCYAMPVFPPCWTQIKTGKHIDTRWCGVIWMLFHASSIFVLSNANFAKKNLSSGRTKSSPGKKKNPTNKIHVGYIHTRLQRNSVLSDDWQRERHGLCAGSSRKTKMILFRILTAAGNNGPNRSQFMTTFTWNKNENKWNANIINLY